METIELEVQTKGRVLIPSHIRKRYKICEGDYVMLVLPEIILQQKGTENQAEATS